MADDQTLTFLGWVRERMADLVTGAAGGRATGQTSVSLSGTDGSGAATGQGDRTLSFALAGPGDVLGLLPGAITRRYPVPGALDHESDRCPHVELAEPSLPWRYTPGPKPAAGTGAVQPWLALVVGVEGDELTLTGDRVGMTTEVQQLHPLGAPTAAHPWAHVQVDGAGHRISRVLCGRALSPGTDYLAVLVPAFRPDGQPSWDGSGPALVGVYDHWRFRTATPAGSFEDLAALLHPGDAPSDTGRAPLDYPRVPAAPDLEVRGALAPRDSTDAPLPSAVAGDLAGLRTPATDEVGRPIVGLPRYGSAWRLDAPEATTWGGTLNGDPRHRGVAGLGLELGIRLQDELVDDAVAHLGALAEARQKVGDLVLGLAASQRLWERRLPDDPHDRLWMMGPALGRVTTEQGPVAQLTTAADRALPQGVWSTAARRVLRTGPARVATTASATATAAPVLAAANRAPVAPAASTDGVTLTHTFDSLLTDTIHRGTTTPIALRALVQEASGLAGRAALPIRDGAQGIARLMTTAAAAGRTAPYLEALLLLVASVGPPPPDAELQRELSVALRELSLRFDQAPPDPKALAQLLAPLTAGSPPPEPPCAAVDLDALATGVVAAFDPTTPDAAARTRVLATIAGLDPAQPLAPPETPVGLDRPVWRDVDTAFKEWLLPGVAALPDDSVIAVETNPAFVDALLVGMNSQLVNELRWRNIPVATGCTPLRSFWQRADGATGARVDDIVGVADWPQGSDLGGPDHRPGGIAGRDLVIVVRGRLFLRYPTTVVYLTSALVGGVASFDTDPPPDAVHLLPTFQGRIGADVTFFGFQGVDPDAIATSWVVFEEPPAGYRFANDTSLATRPEQWAAEAFARPVRVLIRGDRLDPGHH